MRDCVDHYIEDDSGEHSVSTNNWEVWLFLTADPHSAFPIFTADVFAESWVLNEYTQGEHAELGIVCYTRGSIGVL
jgi:hypothetical protein